MCVFTLTCSQALFETPNSMTTGVCWSPEMPPSMIFIFMALRALLLIRSVKDRT